MNLTFRIPVHIARPVREVFEAVADPEKLSRYFTTGGARGRLESGATVYWDFHDFPGEFPVEVLEAIPEQRIVFRWAANDPDAGPEGYKTKVTITFEALPDGRTLVAITESGWRETESGLKASYDNCLGWTQMLCALKAWLEHGINLRQGMFV